jgi:hypothetical protein
MISNDVSTGSGRFFDRTRMAKIRLIEGEALPYIALLKKVSSSFRKSALLGQIGLVVNRLNSRRKKVTGNSHNSQQAP